MQIGPYEVIRLLGEGGMGRVYSARHATLGVERAVKVLARSTSEASATRFTREAEILARVRHPGVVAVHDVGVHGGCPYYSMDLVAGDTLEDVLLRGGQLPLDR